MPFTPEDISFVDIFPPICVARVGDSDEWYVGPEIPGVDPIPQGGFKDSNHKIKKQAARFRVYAYDKNANVLGEIDDKEYELKWTVHVANKKSAWIRFQGQYGTAEPVLRNKDVDPVELGDGPLYANTDKRTKLIIDSGPTSVAGVLSESVALKGEFWGSAEAPTKVDLGKICTDDRGRLIVCAGDGDSFSIIKGDKYPPLQSGFDNDDWVDSMCDGSVGVAVKSKSNPDLKIHVKHNATIITAPPKFASGVPCFTSLFDLIEDVYERQRRGPGDVVKDVEFYRHIQPMFDSLYAVSWTNSSAHNWHGPGKQHMFSHPDLSDPRPEKNDRRRTIFSKLRLPVKKGDKENEAAREKQKGNEYMPVLRGDDGGSDSDNANSWASITQLQYDRFEQWSVGNFKKGEPEVRYTSFDDIPLDKQPEALTRAALEWSIGAALYPGIEAHWVVQFDRMYNKDAKFRFADSVKPGDIGKGLSLPWQSDFYMCRQQWWPSARPDDIVSEADFLKTSAEFAEHPELIAKNLKVKTDWVRGLKDVSASGNDSLIGGLAMVRNWTKLGFVAQQAYGSSSNLPRIYIEKERHPDLDKPQH